MVVKTIKLLKVLVNKITINLIRGWLVQQYPVTYYVMF